MKKIFPFFMAVFMIMSLFSFCFDSGLSSFALELGKKATVIASRCDVYESADFLSNKITVKIDESEETYRLKHGDIVLILEEVDDFCKIQSDDEIEGFVYKFYLTQNSSQVVYPVFNGSVRNETIIYDMDFVDSGFKAQKGERIFIYKSFNEKENYTSVQLVLDDGTLYNGYILTKDVNPDGISGLLIAGISVIIAAVTIILSIIFIKKRKK